MSTMDQTIAGHALEVSTRALGLELELNKARARIAELEALVENLSRPLEDHISEYRRAAQQAVRTSVDVLGRLDLVQQALTSERAAHLATQRALVWALELMPVPDSELPSNVQPTVTAARVSVAQADGKGAV